MNVEHNPAEHHFVASLPEGDAVLSYRIVGKKLMDIQSTYVPSSARGRGVGAALVRQALGYAREKGYSVRPSCWYVGTWVGQHPEYAELLERRG
jgi:predicted GNAT family acetyltransferase